jgi:hypothetical protein
VTDDEARTTARSGKRVRLAPLLVCRFIIHVSAPVARYFLWKSFKKNIFIGRSEHTIPKYHDNKSSHCCHVLKRHRKQCYSHLS